MACSFLAHPFEQVFEAVEPAFPEAFHLARPIDQRAQGADLGAVVRLPALVASRTSPARFRTPRCSRRPVATPRLVPSAPRPSGLLRGRGARRSPALSGPRGFGRACRGRLACAIDNHLAMDRRITAELWISQEGTAGQGDFAAAPEAHDDYGSDRVDRPLNQSHASKSFSSQVNAGGPKGGFEPLTSGGP